MAKRSRKTQKLRDNSQEFVAVTFVSDLEDAKDYEFLLKTNDIPVMIKEQNNQATDTNGIAVLVPEEFLDEAHVIIESQDSYDDFYDYALEEDDIDFAEDFLDNDF